MSLPDILRVLQVTFGIGLVIFVHEGGHFIAARLCKVRVEVFSLGFGPKLFGIRRGETLYQIAAVPIGGYVRMAGEMHDSQGRAPRHDELSAKNVYQRFFIYSGGVIMNVVFALVLFPIVLSSGVPLIEPVLDAPAKGTPAWHAGVEEGTRVVSVNGKEVFDFTHIPQEVAVGGKKSIDLGLLAPGADTPHILRVTPKYDERVGFYRVGVSPGLESTIRVIEGDAAHEAGVREGDQLVGIEGFPKELPVASQWRRTENISRDPITLHVLRDGQPHTFTITPREVEAKRPVYGFQPFFNEVKDLRKSSILRALDLRIGDRVIDVNGRPIELRDDLLPALLSGAQATLVTVDRDGEVIRLDGPALDSSEAVQLDSDVYLDYDRTRSKIIVSAEGAAAAAGVQTGDRVLRIDDELITGWDSLLEAAKKRADRGVPIVLTIARGPDAATSETMVFTMSPGPATMPVFGFGLPHVQYIYRTHGLKQSLNAGLTASWRFLTDAWLTLKKMLTAELSPKNLGGIITISRLSYDWSSQGWAKLFFFLCLLSVNLAFLNVLPIPLLDGGHLLFCIVEAIKGSPVSERTLGYSQVVGLVLILSLMVYVTYNDVVRLF